MQQQNDMNQVAKWIIEAVKEVEGQELPTDKEERTAFWKKQKEKIYKK